MATDARPLARALATAETDAAARAAWRLKQARFYGDTAVYLIRRAVATDDDQAARDAAEYATIAASYALHRAERLFA